MTTDTAEIAQKLEHLQGKFELLDHRLKGVEDAQSRIHRLETGLVETKGELKSISDDIDDLKDSSQKNRELLNSIDNRLGQITARGTAILAFIACIAALAEIYSITQGG